MNAPAEVPIPEESLQQVDPLDLLGHSLWSTVRQTVTARTEIEARWLDDLRQYLGIYDGETQKALASTKDRASVFLNLTRKKTNQAESQLADLLFPTDSKNWGIDPTPVPELTEDLSNPTPVTLPDGSTAEDAETGEAIKVADVAASALAAAREKASKMERLIDDQLVECDYNAEARLALHYAAVLGTGVLAGPEVKTVVKHKWSAAGAQDGTLVHMAVADSSPRPFARNVPVWDFFPDRSATSINDAEFIYERSYLSRKQVRSLAKHKNYLPDALRKVLQSDPRSSRNASAQTNELRRLTTGDTQLDQNDTRYEFWKYSGPINKEALIAAGVPLDPNDPMEEYDGIVVFCGSIVVKAVLNPMDTEEWPYAVFNWHKDDFSIFGFGVPFMCRNEQRILNTAWRMMLDNSSKAAGPQIVVKRSAVAPADGHATITPWKIWWADETVTDVRTAFQSFTWPSAQQEIANILQLAQQFMNETAGLPPEVGQGNGQTPNTLGGMAMLMNSSNTDRRRQVRMWDDEVTKPLIRRFYHWNMQYHPDPSVKGDYEVCARGTSALLLREQQAINLMAVLDKYAAHPALADKLKAVSVLRKVVEAMHVDPDEAVLTDDEVRAAEERRAQEGQPEDPQIVVERMRTEQIQMRGEISQQVEQLRAQLDSQEREADRQLRRDLAMLNAQTEDRRLQLTALQYAQTHNISYQKILADLKKHRWRMALDASKFKTEVALKENEGETANYGLGE